eukprot:525244-Alexandrium_andersonii.AAC.2
MASPPCANAPDTEGCNRRNSKASPGGRGGGRRRVGPEWATSPLACSLRRRSVVALTTLAMACRTLWTSTQYAEVLALIHSRASR